MASLSSFIFPLRAGENINDFALFVKVYNFFFTSIYLSSTFLDENETSYPIYITEAWFRFKSSTPEVSGGNVASWHVSLPLSVSC
jgi:hypothetical protein